MAWARLVVRPKGSLTEKSCTENWKSFTSDVEKKLAGQWEVLRPEDEPRVDLRVPDHLVGGVAYLLGEAAATRSVPIEALRLTDDGQEKPLTGLGGLVRQQLADRSASEALRTLPVGQFPDELIADILQ
ncbi:MAG: hypothetical protein COZ57_04880 [Armatimonadetes bacterium CG_4_8_14_3_um_filter_66_20]|nr:MAG: hypothetical protein COZ57_04880 [Armatimonadetes bacterium CG_4_8_14_3_um_filter_66_20]